MDRRRQRAQGRRDERRSDRRVSRAEEDCLTAPGTHRSPGRRRLLPGRSTVHEGIVQAVQRRQRALRPALTKPARGGLRSGAGLTLIEVLLALFLLGVGLAVIMQGLALGLKVRRETAESQRLSIVAVDRLNRLMTDRDSDPPEEEGSEGEVSWSVERLPFQQEEMEDTSEIDEVRIVVAAPSGRTWELHSLFPRADDEP